MTPKERTVPVQTDIPPNQPGNTTILCHYKFPDILALLIELTCDVFYNIYGESGRSEILNDLLRLDSYPLSIALLVATASHNTRDYGRLAQGVGQTPGAGAPATTKAGHIFPRLKGCAASCPALLRADYNESLQAATIELLLSSPTFCKLDLNADDLLGVVAFFRGLD